MAAFIPSSTVEFEVFFKTHYPSLVQYALRFVPDKDAARDLAQQVFIKLYEKRNELVVHGSVKGYLFQMLKNMAINQINSHAIREKHQKNSVATANLIADLHQELEGKELESQLMEMIELLPERCKLVFKMNRFEGKKNAEIADELKISIRTVETQISKALKALREKWPLHMTTFWLLVGMDWW